MMAAVGDDVWGDDPTVNELQVRYLHPECHTLTLLL